jgi:hypothetical protein
MLTRVVRRKEEIQVRPTAGLACGHCCEIMLVQGKSVVSCAFAKICLLCLDRFRLGAVLWFILNYFMNVRPHNVIREVGRSDGVALDPVFVCVTALLW